MKKEEAPLTVAVLHYIFQPVIFKGCVEKSSLKSSTPTESSRGLGFFVLARSQVIYYVLNIGVFHPYQHVKHYNIDYAARRNIECF